LQTVTVLIPVHDPDHKYQGFISEALASVSMQSINPEQVLLVSNHNLPYLDGLKEKYSEVLTIDHLISSATSATENINFGVANSIGDFVKLLFQDDKLIGKDCLEVSRAPLLEGSVKWSVMGSADVNEDSGVVLSSRYPEYSERLSSGINRIGAPSVVCFARESYLDMDESLEYMFDCDWYLLMSHHFGNPFQIQKIGIHVRIHPGQATNWAKKRLGLEKRYVKKKHHVKLLSVFRKHKRCSCCE
jgi:hypothetical protein